MDVLDKLIKTENDFSMWKFERDKSVKWVNLYNKVYDLLLEQSLLKEKSYDNYQFSKRVTDEIYYSKNVSKKKIMKKFFNKSYNNKYDCLFNLGEAYFLPTVASIKEISKRIFKNKSSNMTISIIRQSFYLRKETSFPTASDIRSAYYLVDFEELIKDDVA